MSATLDKLEGLARKLTIEVPAEEVGASFERIYKNIQRDATIQGFRKGKAPLNKVKSMYKDRVTQDVLQDLVGQSYQKALAEHSLDPIGQPQINVEKFSENDGCKYTAVLEVRPEVNLEKWENLKIQKEILDISADKINEVLESLRKNHTEMNPVLEDRPLQNEDVAEVDFEGFVDNEPLEGGSAKGHLLEIGSNSFIEGFEEALVGMKPSDSKEINLKFPEEYHNADISGKPVLFKVTLQAIKKKVLPELNDEFAKKFGEFEKMDDLKDAIKKDIEANEGKRIHEDLRSRVLRALAEANPIEVPHTLMIDQKARLISDVEQRLKGQGMNEVQMEDYKKRWDSDFDDTSKFMIQSALLVDAMANKFDLHAKDKDIDKRLQEHAEQSGMPVEQLKEFYDKPDQRSRLLYQTTEENVVDYLISKADVTELPADKLTDKKMLEEPSL